MVASGNAFVILNWTSICSVTTLTLTDLRTSMLCNRVFVENGQQRRRVASKNESSSQEIPSWMSDDVCVCNIWAAAAICSVAPVKKIYGVPRPRFNLVCQVLALFHHDWSRFQFWKVGHQQALLLLYYWSLLYEDRVGTQDATTFCCPLRLRAVPI